MPILFSPQNITGTAGSDLIFGAIGQAPNNSLNGGDSADLIVGDATAFVTAGSAGATMATAFNLTSTGNNNFWSTHADPDILDATTIPHATAVIESTGAHHMFRLDMTAGQRLKVDVDYGNHAIGVSADTKVQLLNSAGVVVATGNGNSILGGEGSTSNKDGYLSFLVGTAGTYYVRVVQSGGVNDGGALASGSTYVANFSLTGKATGTLAQVAGDDVIEGGSGADIIYGGAGLDSVTGGDGQDVIYGGDGNDDLRGGLNKDTVYGGAGDDTFVITGNTYAENINGDSGNDTLNLSARSEAFTVNLGTSNYQFTGNTFGDDGTYWLRSVEVVIGSTGGDSLTGNANANTLNGHNGNDSLLGGDGADILNGGAGVDTMTGGRGDDTMYVDSASDIVVEVANGGVYDTVSTSVGYALDSAAQVERLMLSNSAGTSALDLTGNAFSQLIIGNAGNNVIDSGSGAMADVMRGLGGNDIYKVRNAGDRIDEAAGGGTVDIIESFVSFALASDDHIEFLQTDDENGTSSRNLTGNNLAQTIEGNDGNNIINGKGGADTLIGNDGEDRFVFDMKATNGNVDFVADFDVADDTMAINNRFFRKMPNGDLDESRFESNATGEATATATRIIYNSATGEVIHDRNGDGAGGSTVIAILEDGLAMTHENFLIL
jgi:Ca2+-binding RTX toxin-like protein